MTSLQALLLGILQGITEFFPVSSSSHLALARRLMQVEGSLYFDLLCHLGTLLAVILVLRKEVWQALTHPRSIALFTLALFPLIPAYFLLKPLRLSLGHQPGLFLLVTSALLFLACKKKSTPSEPLHPKYRDVLWIGIAQSFALLPGISRSASTLSVARLLGWQWADAARFSFLLAIPTILGGCILETLGSLHKGEIAWSLCAIGCTASFLVGIVAIRVLFWILQRGHILPFAWYCLFVGLISYSMFTAAEGVRDSKQIDQIIQFLYENKQRGRLCFVPGIGHKIMNDSPEQKTQRYAAAQEGAAVTYALSSGRLGDNLLSYLHARWIAYCNHLPLVRKAFPMDDEFALINEPPPLVEGLVVEVPYFQESLMKYQSPPFVVDWDDPGFRQQIIQCLTPTRPHSLLELPTDRITVCVHVRRGGAFDSPVLHREYPLKFPPDSYYIEQIRTIAKLFSKKLLYVFLMTDDLHPKTLVQRYQKAVADPNIQWDCRKKPPENDLDDFFSIPLFDCLILCDSNFSIVASKLSEYAIRIAPTHYTKKKKKVRIIGLDIAVNPHVFEKNIHQEALTSAR